MAEPGAEQDLHTALRWREIVFSKHKLVRFAPPQADCHCKNWQRSATHDRGLYAQRDWLLDEFLQHKSFMRAERRRIVALEAIT